MKLKKKSRNAEDVFKSIVEINEAEEEPMPPEPRKRDRRKRSKTPKRESPVPKNIRYAFKVTKGVFLATWKKILPGWALNRLRDNTARAVSRLKNLKLRL